ncbi:Ff.00g117610.m01.CDS01 [Fusarium sp. VM40]|nr:Ff.00g117610.m01.CDS01 [Fusarium sp. VM40]
MKFSIVLSTIFAAITIASPTSPAAEGNEVRGVNDVFEANEARACKLRDGHCSKDSECCSVGNLKMLDKYLHESVRQHLTLQKKCAKRYPSAPSARCD